MHGDLAVALRRDDGAGQRQDVRRPRGVFFVEAAQLRAKRGQPLPHLLHFGGVGRRVLVVAVTGGVEGTLKLVGLCHKTTIGFRLLSIGQLTPHLRGAGELTQLVVLHLDARLDPAPALRPDFRGAGFQALDGEAVQQ